MKYTSKSNSTQPSLPGQLLSTPELPLSEFLDNLHCLMDPFVPPPLVHGSSPSSGKIHLQWCCWQPWGFSFRHPPKAPFGLWPRRACSTSSSWPPSSSQASSHPSCCSPSTWPPEEWSTTFSSCVQASSWSLSWSQPCCTQAAESGGVMWQLWKYINSPFHEYI